MEPTTLKLARSDDEEAEIFRSFQGEGPMAGQIRAFIRLSGCNLHCRWCDTPYTWNWKGTPYQHQDGEKFAPAAEMVRLTADAAAQRIWATNTPGLVITGGEPLMQARGVTVLCQLLKEKDAEFRLEVETNGTLEPPSDLASMIDLFVVSPKLPHAGHNDDVLAPALANHHKNPRSIFKFVAKTPSDIELVQQSTEGIEPERVWFMPEGRTPAELDRHLTAISPAVLQAGYNLTDRQHIRLFGDCRGT
jgi:organic radical activating enzyme